MEFRKAIPEDAALLTELSITSKRYWGYGDYFIDAVRHELRISSEQINRGFCEIAQSNESPVGFILFLPQTEHVELEALFVLPEWIGTGVGSALIKRGKEWAIANSFSRIFTTADPNAEEFYVKKGFVKIGDVESSSFSSRLLPRLVLKLNEI